MSFKTKMNKAERMGITFEEGFVPDEKKLDDLIEQKQKQIDQQKEEDKIRKAAEKKAADEAKKNTIILKDVDGDDVDQSEYFYPRMEDEKLPDGKILKATDQTAPFYFNRSFGLPVDREELIEVFVRYFPRKKGFLFYRMRDREVYLVIVPLKYAKTVSRENESLPGDFQKHALSFITEGSVNLDSLRMKLERIQKHHTISQEPLA